MSYDTPMGHRREALHTYSNSLFNMPVNAAPTVADSLSYAPAAPQPLQTIATAPATRDGLSTEPCIGINAFSSLGGLLCASWTLVARNFAIRHCRRRILTTLVRATR